MASQNHYKVLTVWEKIDQAFLMLAQIGFEQCWSLIELREAGEKIRMVFDTKYPDSERKPGLQNQLSGLYTARKNYIDSLAPAVQEPSKTGFNRKA